MAQWCNWLPWNSAWGSVLALFCFKTKSPKDITIRPVEGRVVVSELTECANAGEPSQKGRGFSPSDGVQIARELNNTGWTIGLGVGIPSSNPVVSHTKRCVSCRLSKDDPSAFQLNIWDIVYNTLQSISLFNCFCLFVFHIFVFDYWLLCRKEFGFLCLLRRSREQIGRSVLLVKNTNMRHSNHLQWKLIWQNQDTEPCQKIFPSLPRSTKCQFLSIYVESTKEMK